MSDASVTGDTFWSAEGVAWVRLAAEHEIRFAAAAAAAQAASPFQGIPRVIHHVWLGGDIPSKLRKLRETWTAALPDCTHILWSDDCLTECAWQNAAWVQRATNRGQQSDILRLEILRAVGGLYVDTDMLLLQPGRLERLLDLHEAVLGVSNCAVFELNNAVMGCVPHHPLLFDMIDAVHRNCSTFSDGLDARDAMATISRTGPGMVTRTVMTALMRGHDMVAREADEESMASIVAYACRHATGAPLPTTGRASKSSWELSRVLLAPRDVFYPVRNDVMLPPPYDVVAQPSASSDSLTAPPLLTVCGMDCSAVQQHLTEHSIAVHYWARTWQRKAAQLTPAP